MASLTKTSLSLFIGLAIALTPLYTVSAQSDQRQFLESEIHLSPWFDYTDDGSIRRDYSAAACELTTNLVGSDNAQRAFNFFMEEDRGLTAPQAAGIVGNLMVEAGPGIDPAAENPLPDSREEAIAEGTPDAIISDAYGIAQWLGVRRPPMLAWTSDWMGERRLNIPADEIVAYFQTNKQEEELQLFFEAQLNFIWHEITVGGEKGSLTDLTAQTTAEQAAISWEANYERAGGSGLQDRIDNAIFVLDEYGSDYGGDVTSGSRICGVTERGEVIADFSLPVRRSFFDEFPSELTEPHWNKNAAIDIGKGELSKNEPIFSMTSGTIVSTGTATGAKCGLGVIIETPDGLQFLYCHGSDGGQVPNAATGDVVKAGQLIMHMSDTGSADGIHLHLEIREYQTAENFTRYCPQELILSLYNGVGLDPRGLPTSGCTS